MNHRQAWARLDEFLDGALAAEARWALAAHLDECAVCRAYVAEQARLRGVVRERLVAPEFPPGLNARLAASLAAEAAAPPTPAQQPRPPRLVAVATLLGPALAALWLLALLTVPGTRSGADQVGELALTHALFAQDESLLDVAGDAAAVTAWFRDTAGIEVSAPHLEGYTLVGGRLIGLDGRAAAQLVYEGKPDEVYVSLVRFAPGGPEPGQAAPGDGFAVAQRGNTSLVTWDAAGDRVALIGSAPVSELRRLAGDLSAGSE